MSPEEYCSIARWILFRNVLGGVGPVTLAIIDIAVEPVDGV